MSKRGKKKYNKVRDMNLVCLDCNCLFKECACTSTKRTTYILANGKELAHYFKTGLVPDYTAELMWCEGQPKPPPVPLVYPPQYGFKI